MAATIGLYLLTGCATAPPAPREYLDERTAATITVAPRPVVLACDRTDLGVHARDYVTITSVDVNLAGRHTSYLVGYSWSTLDKRDLQEGPATYELVADDRVLRLEPVPAGFGTLGIAAPPLETPARGAVPLVGTASRETLQYFLEARALRLVRTRDGGIERFAPWETGDAG